MRAAGARAVLSSQSSRDQQLCRLDESSRALIVERLARRARFSRHCAFARRVRLGLPAARAMARAVACFVVCGLPPSPTPESGPASGFIGAGATYVPAVLSSYPALPPEGASPASSGNNAGARAFPATPASPADPPRARLPWPADLPAMCLPEGVDVHVSAPDRDALAPRSYPLVVVSESEDDDADASSPSSPPRAAASDLGASVTHVACVSFLEPVPEATAALNPTLRSAFARKCSASCRAPSAAPAGTRRRRRRHALATLAAALEAIRRRCFHPHRARDAAPLADVVAAIVDGLPAPRPGAPRGSSPRAAARCASRPGRRTPRTATTTRSTRRKPSEPEPWEPSRRRV